MICYVSFISGTGNLSSIFLSVLLELCQFYYLFNKQFFVFLDFSSYFSVFNFIDFFSLLFPFLCFLWVCFALLFLVSLDVSLGD